jgi:uncharacterized protein YxjI
MALFGNLVNNTDMSGYKRLDNPQGWDNQALLARLYGVATSLGQPRIGTARIMGKDSEAVLYESAGETSLVYVRANGKKIDIGKAPKGGMTGANMLNRAIVLAGGGEDAEGVKLNRAVDELQGVLERLLAGQTVTATQAAAVAASGSTVKLYMEEKLSFSVRDRYTIFTADQQPAFYVESNMADTAYKVMDAGGNEAMVVKKKLISVMPEYTVTAGKQEIGSFKKKLKLTRTEIVGTVGGAELTIKGDMYGGSFNILLGGAMIGSVDKERLTWASCYRIESYDPRNVYLIVAISVIVEALKKLDQKKD